MNKPLVHRLLMSDFCLLILSAARSGPSRAPLSYDTRTIVSTRKANGTRPAKHPPPPPGPSGRSERRRSRAWHIPDIEEELTLENKTRFFRQ